MRAEATVEIPPGLPEELATTQVRPDRESELDRGPEGDVVVDHLTPGGAAEDDGRGRDPGGRAVGPVHIQEDVPGRAQEDRRGAGAGQRDDLGEARERVRAPARGRVDGVDSRKDPEREVPVRRGEDRQIRGGGRSDDADGSR